VPPGPGLPDPADLQEMLAGMDESDTSPRFASAPAGTSMPDWYPELLASVAAHVSTGHRRAISVANTELLRTYWSIGKEILARQHEEGWGASLGVSRKLVRHVNWKGESALSVRETWAC
jgi:hypothetical protein